MHWLTKILDDYETTQEHNYRININCYQINLRIATTMAADEKHAKNILDNIARLDKFHDVVLVAGEDGQR